MARPERNDIDYFPHEVNHGRKMHIIESKYGNDGYAVWFKLLEQLGKADYHYIDVRDEANYMYLESIFKTDKIGDILNDLAKLGAIDKTLWEERIIWSQKFTNNIQDAYKKRNNNCQTIEGLRERIKGLQVQKQASTKIKGVDNPQRKVKDSKGYKSKENNGEQNSLFKSMMKIYYDWFEDAYKMKPKIDGGDGKALKQIIAYFKLNCKDDIIIMDSWKLLFEHWNKLSKFYKNQTRLRQISSNIQNIILELKTNLKKNNYHDSHPELFNTDGSLKYGF